jgi:hypothetical protein
MGILAPFGFCEAVLPQLVSIDGETYTHRNRVFIDMGLGGGHLLAFCRQREVQIRCRIGCEGAGAASVTPYPLALCDTTVVSQSARYRSGCRLAC